MSQELLAEVDRILLKAHEEGVNIVLFGSIGVKKRSTRHVRFTFDIDFVGFSEQKHRIINLFKSLDFSYRPSSRGRTYLVFFKKEPFKLKIDVDLDSIHPFDHPDLKLPLRDGIQNDQEALSPPYLLLSKLFPPITSDSIYDVICLLLDDPPNPVDVKAILEDNSNIRPRIKDHLNSLTKNLLRVEGFESKEKMQALRIAKNLLETI